MSHMLIKDVKGDHFIIKKSDIRRIYKDNGEGALVCFTGQKNTPIRVPETVEDFFNIHLAK